VDNITKEDWTIGGLALLLVIVLVALPWFSVGGGSIEGVHIPSINLVGTDGPDSLLGVLAVLASLAVIADLAIERFAPQTTLPNLGGSRTSTRFVFAAAAAAFMVLKFLFQLSHFSNLGWGFWVGVIVAGGLVFTTLKASGGTLSLPSMPKGPAA
jgi:hypothetical protein